MNTSDLHIVKQEIFDPDAMERILKDINSFSKTDLNKLKTYKKHRIHGNVVEVVYHYGKGCDEYQLGRLYAKNNIGIQSFPKVIRNSLLEKFYWDIDFENSHFNLLLKLGENFNIKTDNIKYYCMNRDECLKMVSEDRHIAKIAFLKIAYGGDVKLCDINYDDVHDSLPQGDLSILKSIEKEVDSLMEMCYAYYKKYHKLVSKKKNKKASLFALILQTEERKCLLALDEYLKTMNRRADIYIHDGLEVRKLDNEKIFPIELLRGGEEFIYNTTGHKIKLVQKSLKNEYVINEEDKIIIDDIYATRTYIKLMDNKVVKDGDDIYFFNNDTGIYEKGKNAFFTSISKIKDDLIFIDNRGNQPKEYNYGGVLKYMTAIYKLLPSQLPDDNFISKNIDTSIGKLLFSNGIYNFRDNSFTPGFNPDIVFFTPLDI